MTGTTIAQAIPIAISPILTRIYTPEDFGVFALYMGVTSIVSVVATGRYELAIMLPKKDEDAINIVALSITITLFVSLITLFIVTLFNTAITRLLGNQEISNWLYFMPLTILLTGVYQSLKFWSNRQKQYKDLAINRVTQSTVTATSNLSLGFVGLGSGGLVIGGFIGQSLATMFLYKMINAMEQSIFKKVKKLKIIALSKRYINFPKFDILASLSNVSSRELIHILFNSLFSTAIAGYYYLTQRALGLPISILASSILDVFKERASKDYKQYGNAKAIYISTFKKLILLSAIPSILLYIFALDIFTFVFGENWIIAGEFTQILIPMFFLQFISSPLSFMIYISEKQKVNIIGQFLFLFSTVIGFYLGETPYDVVLLLSIFFSLIYIYYLYVSAKMAKVFKKGNIC